MEHPNEGGIDVKEVVRAVRRFIEDLFGPNQLQYAALEEVALSDSANEWKVTMSFSSSSFAVIDPSRRDYKIFTVDATTGMVKSMKIRDAFSRS